MTRRRTSWPRRVGRWTSKLLSHHVQHLFTLLPGCEYGLSRPQLSTLPVHYPPLTGRRAVQLSDLHLDRYLPRHEQVLRTVQDLRPDWIFVTGDLLNVPSGLRHLFRFLAALRAVAPVYVTLGNHDHYSGVPVERFVVMAQERRIHLLINEQTTIAVGNHELVIVGVDDPSLHRARLHCVPPEAPHRFTLLLAHAPNIFDELAEHHHVDLTLCGHSHGGQWRPPLVHPFWLPSGCSGRTGGYYEQGRHRMYVNRGLGWSFLPLRWNCPPEILLLEWTDQPISRAA